MVFLKNVKINAYFTLTCFEESVNQKRGLIWTFSMRIRHRGGEDSNLIFRRKVVLHSGVRLGRVGCSRQVESVGATGLMRTRPVPR